MLRNNLVIDINGRGGARSCGSMLSQLRGKLEGDLVQHAMDIKGFQPRRYFRKGDDVDLKKQLEEKELD